MISTSTRHWRPCTLPLGLASKEPHETLRAYVRMYLSEDQERGPCTEPAGLRPLPTPAGLFTAKHSTLRAWPVMQAWYAQPSRATSKFLKIRCSVTSTGVYSSFARGSNTRSSTGSTWAWCALHQALMDQSVTAKRDRGTAGGWVYTLLRTYMEERDLADEIAYWAPASTLQTEVNFVLRRGLTVVRARDRGGTRLQPQHLAGLRAIADLPGLVRRALVYAANIRLRPRTASMSGQ
jgi:hypothetical protein